MKIQALGHVVLKVRNRAKAEAFYNGILGLPIVARYEEMGMTFFSLGNHHDFAVAAVGDEAHRRRRPNVAREAIGIHSYALAPARWRSLQV